MIERASWIAASALVVFAWTVCLRRARGLARTIDRAEVIVLKPLSVGYLVFAIATAISHAWIAAGSCMLAWWLNGLIGGSLHTSQDFTKLAQGTFSHMEQGPRVDLSSTESRKVASVVLRAAGILGAVLAVILLTPLRWYVALPIAAVVAWLFLALSSFLVAYRKTPASPSTTAG